MPYTSAVVVNVALKNFKDLVDELCKMNSDYAEAFDELEEYYDVDEKLLAGFPGEISFALDGKGINTRSVPGFAFFMECKRNVWEYVELNLEPEYYEDVAHVSYEKDHIAAIDAVTYAAADLKGKKSFADSEYAKLIKKGGVLVDLSAFPASVLNSMAEEIDYSMTKLQGLSVQNAMVSSYIINSPIQICSKITSISRNKKIVRQPNRACPNSRPINYREI